MKNRIIKLICTSSIIIFLILGITRVFANPEGGTNASSQSAYTSSCSEGKICFQNMPVYNNGKIIEGVRISLVHQNGERIAGTTSIDVVNNKALFNNVEDGTVFAKGNLKFTALWAKGVQTDAQTVRVKTISDDGRDRWTRNEILSGLPTGIKEYGTVGPEAYYWADLPTFINTEDEHALRRFIISQFNNNYEVMQQLFRLLNYSKANYSKADLINENDDLLLVEPLVYFQYHMYGHNARNESALQAYYGTGTEVYYIRTRIDGLGNARFIARKYSIAIYVDEINKGGLTSITSLVNAIKHDQINAENYILSGTSEGYYGTAAGHFWITDKEDCGPCCNEPCPGTEKSCVYNGFTSDFSSNCDTNTSGSIADTKNWNCILKQRDESKNSYQGSFYQDIATGISKSTTTNNYCTIACNETIVYNYPSTKVNIYAGNKFVIGSSAFQYSYTDGLSVLSPVTITATKVCKTGVKPSVSAETLKNISEAEVSAYATIDVEKFISDYQAADKEMILAWDNYQIALLAERARDAANSARDNNKDGVPAPETMCSQSDSWTITKGKSHATGKEFTVTPTITCTEPSEDPVCTGTKDGSSVDLYDSVNGIWNTYYPNSRNSTKHVLTSYTQKAEYTTSSGRKESAPKTAIGSSCGSHNSDATITPMSDELKTRIKNEGWTSRNITDALTSEEGKIQYYKHVYEQKKAYRDGLVNSLIDCNNYYNEYKELNPNLTFKFKDNNEYSVDVELKKVQSSFSVTTSYDGSGIKNRINSDGSIITDLYDTDKLASASCTTNGQNCTYYKEKKDNNGNTVTDEYGDIVYELITISYPKTRRIETTTIKSYDYELPDGMYNFIMKSGLSLSELPANSKATVTDYTVEADENGNFNVGGTSFTNSSWGVVKNTTKVFNWDGTLNYEEVKYSNVPVSFRTWSGFYNYELILDSNKYGANQRFTKYMSALASNVTNNDFIKTYTSDFEYTCDVQITNCILEPCQSETITNQTVQCDDACCPPNNCGLNIIYRPISLSNPFPGEYGKTRTAGDNWSGIGVAETYITNNRGVKEEQVYFIKPMYQFVLNSSNMRMIRAYNNTQNSDYNDYDLVCTNNEYCKSEFLRDGVNKGYFKLVDDGGSCYNATDETWESCRLIED